MSRGPKTKTPDNAPRQPHSLPYVPPSPPSDLSPAAKAEFLRLCVELDNRGSLHRVDLAICAECARVKDLLDRLCAAVGDSGEPDRNLVKSIGLMMSQRRGLLRELGLTIKPSNTVVKTTAKNPESPEDPIAGKIKIHA